MAKHVLEQTKQEFVGYFNTLPDSMRMQLIMTEPNAKTELARWRRLHIKSLNDWHLRELKVQAANRPPRELPEFLEHRQVEVAPIRITGYKCRHCIKRFVSTKRRRTHERKYHD